MSQSNEPELVTNSLQLSDIKHWVIVVGSGYGAFLFEGTAEEAEERRAAKANWEHAESEQARISRFARERRATGGYWSDADWIPCRGGKWRPIEPGTFPLAHGIAQRMDKLRAYGNAIVPQVAATLIEAYIQVEAEQ